MSVSSRFGLVLFETQAAYNSTQDDLQNAVRVGEEEERRGTPETYRVKFYQ